MKKVQTNTSNKTHSISNTISLHIINIVVLTCIILGFIACITNYKNSMHILSNTLNETSSVAANQIAAELRELSNVAWETGCTARLANPDISDEAKKEILEQKKEYYKFSSFSLIHTTGYSIFEEADLSNQIYFKEAMKGISYISDPMLSTVTNESIIIIASPLWENGIPNTNVMGVVTFSIPGTKLSTIVNSIQIGKKGSAYMLNSEGITIAHKDSSIIGVENVAELAKTDSSLKALAKLEQRMVSGEDASGTYSYNGKKKLLSFSPVPNTPGWSVAICVEISEFLSYFYLSLGLTVLCIIITIIIGCIRGRSIGKKIATPIRLCMERLQKLSSGDLHSEVPTIQTKDETALLAMALSETISKLNSIIKDISFHLSSISNGDLTNEVTKFYDGDMIALKDSIIKILDSLNTTIHGINQGADLVLTGSTHLSEASQSLAEGASDQASSVEELTATINTVSEQVSHNEQNTQQASEKVRQMSDEINSSNQKMISLTKAMNDIKTSSEAIVHIIKTIEDIATQTNLLSLNAAIEAARAGDAGKGFAVVAEEVRQLASESAKAAKDTTALIYQAIQSVETGTSITDTTAESLSSVVQGAKQVETLILNIASSSKEQSEAILQINEGIEQVSSVVQSNSATSEETAASSQELSAQAEHLNQMVSKFICRKNE